jgi:hypothetical protein
VTRPDPVPIVLLLVRLDDPQAPLGCAALRVLAGVPLVLRALAALTGSGCAGGGVDVLAPVALTAALRRLLPDVREGVAVRVVAQPPPLGAGLVVLHDALYPLVPPTLVREVAGRLTRPDAGAVVGAAALGTVTDTLTWVGPDGVLADPADRDTFRVPAGPQAYRGPALRGALAAGTWTASGLLAGGVLAALPGQLARAGQVAGVPAPQEVFRVAADSDLDLAEAVLAEAGLAEAGLARQDQPGRDQAGG